MDVGAGTGLSSAPLLRWFEQVIAIEPDLLMAAELVKSHPEIVLKNCTAEDCVIEEDSADLITCGTCFHWLNGLQALQRASRWLDVSGVLAIYTYRFPVTVGAVRDIVSREFEQHWEKFRHGHLREPESARGAVSDATGFRDIHEIVIPNVRTLTPRQFVGFCLSTSYGSAYARTLVDPASYWRELESAFQKASSNDMIPADFELWLVLGHKN